MVLIFYVFSTKTKKKKQTSTTVFEVWQGGLPYLVASFTTNSEGSFATGRVWQGAERTELLTR